MAIFEKDAFKFCMVCGGQFVNISNIEKECSSCGYTYFIAPKPSASALIFNSNNELLLIKRKRNPNKGTWDIPAGFLDDNETIEQALIREVTEEVGINISDFKYYKSIIVNYEFKGIVKRALNTVFICTINKDAVIKPGDDAESFKFVDLNSFDVSEIGFVEIQNLILDFKNN